MACIFCKSESYIKVTKYERPVCAHLTKADKLRRRLQGLTGEVYVQVPKNFCPICGAKMYGGKAE